MKQFIEPLDKIYIKKFAYVFGWVSRLTHQAHLVRYSENMEKKNSFIQKHKLSKNMQFGADIYIFIWPKSKMKFW